MTYIVYHGITRDITREVSRNISRDKSRVISRLLSWYIRATFQWPGLSHGMPVYKLVY